MFNHQKKKRAGMNVCNLHTIQQLESDFSVDVLPPVLAVSRDGYFPVRPLAGQMNAHTRNNRRTVLQAECGQVQAELTCWSRRGSRREKRKKKKKKKRGKKKNTIKTQMPNGQALFLGVRRHLAWLFQALLLILWKCKLGERVCQMALEQDCLLDLRKI